MPEALRGDLEHVSLASLLQLAETEYLCGVMSLDRGSVEIYNGEVVSAEYMGLSGSQAVIEALLRAAGDFSLETIEESSKTGAVGTVMNLVLESCRLQDEAERLAPLALVATAGFQPEQAHLKKLASHLDGKHSLGAAITRSGVPLTPVLDEILAAFDDGRILSRGRVGHEGSVADMLADSGEAEVEEVAEEPTPQPTSPAPEPEPETRSFDDLVFEARRKTRSRDYAEAEALLEAALRLRPGHRIAVQNLNRIKSLMSQPA